MEIFVFDPSNEKIKEFNERIYEFCAEAYVVDIHTQTFGNSLVLSMIEVDDLPVVPPGHPILLATVRPLQQREQQEAYLNGVLEKIEELNDPDDEESGDTIPVRLAVEERKDKPGNGWAVFICSFGAYLGEEEEHKGEIISPSFIDGAKPVEGEAK